jgi:hypothetical protein
MPNSKHDNVMALNAYHRGSALNTRGRVRNSPNRIHHPVSDHTFSFSCCLFCAVSCITSTPAESEQNMRRCTSTCQCTMSRLLTLKHQWKKTELAMQSQRHTTRLVRYQ